MLMEFGFSVILTAVGYWPILGELGTNLATSFYFLDYSLFFAKAAETAALGVEMGAITVFLLHLYLALILNPLWHAMC